MHPVKKNKSLVQLLGGISVETPGGVPDSIPEEISGIITKWIPVSFLENSENTFLKNPWNNRVRVTVLLKKKSLANMQIPCGIRNPYT